MSLTIQQKGSLRRHMGYPTVGLPTINPSGGSFYNGSIGYRWFQAYGFLEYKMTALNPDEESRITGNAYGAILVQGNTQVGDTVTATVSGGPLSGPQTVTYTAGSKDNALTMAAGVANLLNQNATLTAAGFFAVAPYGTGPYSYSVTSTPLSEVAIQNAQSFNFTASATGATSAAVTSNGILLHPRAVLTDPYTNTMTQIYGYLPILDALETGAVGTSEDLDTLQADVWKARQDELEEREKLYKFWRIRLSKFLYIPLWEETAINFMWGSREGPEAFI